ncbi:SAM-dependent methyltransferase [Desulfatitalea tepidiphila]|uniref:SAM-dependent methyltransferase n=1 Tax=Desulfatitalea tepidiphila TaxID=1185843 RepID=UPI00097563E7|nr:SAM-dependent methyltransferase [Desulfatitalea tepidiphila]
MRRLNPSRTAEHNAFLRAVESLRPTAERICMDPYAKYFLSPQLMALYHDAEKCEQLIRHWEEIVPGVCGAVLARFRFIDTYLCKCLDSGLEQVVILGAGYDTRALRFKQRFDNRVKIFGLDHPATQAVKIRCLKNMRAAFSSPVVYVPICFETEKLDEKLFENGFQKDLYTLFIWEGVTYYIPHESIDDTLLFISRNSEPGSAVVFDYLPCSVAEGTCLKPEAKGLKESLQHFGEDIVFGIDPGRIGAFLHSRGFIGVNSMAGDEFWRNCPKGRHQDRSVSDIFMFAHARVKPKP